MERWRLARRLAGRDVVLQRGPAQHGPAARGRMGGRPEPSGRGRLELVVVQSLRGVDAFPARALASWRVGMGRRREACAARRLAAVVSSFFFFLFCRSRSFWRAGRPREGALKIFRKGEGRSASPVGAVSKQASRGHPDLPSDRLRADDCIFFFRMDSQHTSEPSAVKTINKTTGPKNDRGILLRLCLLAANRLREPQKERGARAGENEARSALLRT